MTSILTNTAAMTSLQALSNTQRQLSKTQSQVSSGLAVATASDNAAYWSISSTMKAQMAGLDASRDGLSLQIDVDSVANTGLQAVLKSLSAIKSDIVLARQAGTDRSVLQQDISAQQEQIASTVYDSNFNGVNALESYMYDKYTYSNPTLANNQNKDFIEGHPAYQSGPSDLGSFGFPDDGVRDSGEEYLGVLSEGVIETSDNISSGSSAVKISGTYFTSVLDFTIDGSRSTDTLYTPQPLNAASDSDLDQITTGIDRSISIMTAVGAGLGADMTTATNLQDYDASLSDALTSGVGSLVDADMNVASTRLQALQTQQQLGIQALSIANQNSQLILKLFGQ